MMFAMDIRGRLVTDDWLRVLGAPSVFALGDCAVVDQKPLPQTAQVSFFYNRECAWRQWTNVFVYNTSDFLLLAAE